MKSYDVEKDIQELKIRIHRIEDAILRNSSNIGNNAIVNVNNDLPNYNGTHNSRNYISSFFAPASVTVPEDFKLFLIKEDKPGQRIMLIEPFTWAWVGLKLVEGALAWVGGKILEELSGQLRDNDKSLEAILSDSARITATTIREVLREESIRRAAVALEGLTGRLNQYLRSPDTNVNLLDQATGIAIDLVAEWKSFGLLGHHSFLCAANTQILVIQERVKRYGNSEKESLKEYLNTAMIHARKMDDAWVDWHRGRAGPVERFPYSFPDRPNYPRFSYKWDGEWVYFLADDGLPVWNTPELAQERRDAWVENSLEKTIIDQVNASLSIEGSWWRLRNEIG